MTEDDTALVEHLTRYRHVRDQIERSILPLATSVDGRTFSVQASLHDLALRRGAYVVLESQGRSRLGQVTDLEVSLEEAKGEGLVGMASSVFVRLARGHGMMLDPQGDPFHDAVVRAPTADELDAVFAGVHGSRAGLTIGELLHAPGVPVTLDSGGFNRHTFMCGQSGSGKTYSLGLLLERILAQTTLRVVILDPNSDYVGLGRLREGADPEAAGDYRGVPQEVAVWSNDPGGEHLLRVRFAELDPAVQAAILGLDPVKDREEYAVLNELVRSSEAGKPLVGDVDQLMHAGTESARALGLRAENLGVTRWRLWSPVLPSLVQELRSPTSRCTVVDLGSLDTVAEQRLVAETVLATLWEARRSREPCLVVIDEAHNICPAEPPDAVTSLATEYAVQIAAEGRKFGLYLLTSTQRPHKVHQNIVSQCDNLLLMRMNSESDLGDLRALFSFVPPGLMAGATTFRMGQALVAGKIFPQAAYVQMGARVSQEGGADIPTSWAEPRPPAPLIPGEG
jgi:DNA helicase HerA-like ATPase